MKILMLGNSYTYFFDLPALLNALLTENGIDVQVDAVTAGGRELCQNLDEADALHAEIVEKCKHNTYDVLILQEQSSNAMECYREFLRGVCGCVELVKPARTVLYATWGRKQGSDLLERFGWTSDEMTDGLARAYDWAAKKVGGECAHVGLCFRAVRKAYPDAELYDPDLSHPSYAGSCTAALVMYKTLMGSMPQSTGTLKLDADVIARIAAVVDQTI